jgi:hypothetical protein
MKAMPAKQDKKKTTFLHPELQYPTEALYNPQLDPDNYPLFEFPKDETTVHVGIYRMTPKVIDQLIKPTFQDAQFQMIRKKPSWEIELAKRMMAGRFNCMEIWEWSSLRKLLNAHHRAEAALQAKPGACFLAICAFGLNPENYKYYDDNQKREVWQLLVYKYPKLFTDTDARNKSAARVLGATTWWLRLYWDAKELSSREAVSKTDRIERWGFEPQGKEIIEQVEDTYHGVIAKDQFEAIYNNLQELRSIKGLDKHPVASETVFLTLYTLGKEIMPRKAKEFVSALMTSKVDMTDPTHPIAVCYKWLEKNRDIPGKRRVYSSLRITVGLACMRMFFDMKDGDTDIIPVPNNVTRQCTFENSKTYRGLILGGRQYPGIAGVPRLSAEEDKLFQMEEDRLTEQDRIRKDAETADESKKFATKLIAAEDTPIEGLSKRTKALLDLKSITTLGDLTRSKINDLLVILSSRQLDEVKTLLNGFGLSFAK